jgi:hypothetical protein
MNILHLLASHRHYWGIPHERSADKRIIQTCYECGESVRSRLSCTLPSLRKMRGRKVRPLKSA